MSEFLEYLSAIWPLTPLLLFILAVIFRLLDNSTSLFLQKEILVTSSNVSRNLLKEQIQESEDHRFTQKLKLALVYRNLHQSLMLLAAVSLPLICIAFFLR